MQFWVKLVKRQNDPRLIVSQAGGIFMVACFLLVAVLEKMGKSSELAMVGVIAGLCLALVGWILREFKVAQPLVTDTDIVISIEEIRVGDQSFSVDRVEFLDFFG